MALPGLGRLISMIPWAGPLSLFPGRVARVRRATPSPDRANPRGAWRGEGRGEGGRERESLHPLPNVTPTVRTDRVCREPGGPCRFPARCLMTQGQPTCHQGQATCHQRQATCHRGSQTADQRRRSAQRNATPVWLVCGAGGPPAVQICRLRQGKMAHSTATT